MKKNFRLVTFVIFSLALILLVKLHTGSFRPPSGDESIWFNTGLLTLLLGTFFVEHRFTAPNDVFINCIVVFASISTLDNPPYQGWWELLRWGSFVVGTAAAIIGWDAGLHARLTSGLFRSSCYALVTKLGSSKVIFSLVFILALVSYFDHQDQNTKILVIMWGLFLLVSVVELPELSQFLMKQFGRPTREVVGTAHSFLAPNIVYCEKVGSANLGIYSIVGFSQSPRDSYHSVGAVIGSRHCIDDSNFEIVLLKGRVSDQKVNQNTIISRITESEYESIQDLCSPEILASIKKVVGTAVAKTNISQLKFELVGRPTLAAGSLLYVKSDAGTCEYFQIFDAELGEEADLGDSNRAYTQGKAEQLGVWSDEVGGFETYDWVASPRAPVFLADENDRPPNHTPTEDDLEIGSVPRSSFPVNISLSDVVLYHSAILGVTGSGKSFLAFSLIEACAESGIKVICMDPSGDYQKYLRSAVLLNRPGATDAFLNSPDHRIGIIETAANNTLPVEQAKILSEKCLNWCKSNRAGEDVLNPKPKLLLVLEEAHLLVPEFNFAPRDQQNIVNRTAQAVLQARKYGLGFLVISQRTANVVKSVLNQCNTIFAFQAFDETGFDFLRNYMGSFHVSSLPNLRSRHGILVGKASKSRRPLMVRYPDIAREPSDQALAEMPLPDPGEVLQVRARPVAGG